eukprot:scaffold10382_cov65-Phaeocystis_antarctica.AAC.2
MATSKSTALKNTGLAVAVTHDGKVLPWVYTTASTMRLKMESSTNVNGTYAIAYAMRLASVKGYLVSRVPKVTQAQTHAASAQSKRDHTLMLLGSFVVHPPSALAHRDSAVRLCLLLTAPSDRTS